MPVDRINDTIESAHVFAFPPSRRTDMVDTAVQALLTRNRESGRKFWEKHRDQIGRDLKALGLPSKEIDKLLADYSRTVRQNMQMRLATTKAQ